MKTYWKHKKYSVHSAPPTFESTLILIPPFLQKETQTVNKEQKIPTDLKMKI